MRLQYTQGDERVVYWRRRDNGDLKDVVRYHFAPMADVDDRCGEKLLKDHPRLFIRVDEREVKPELFECNRCLKIFKTKAALGSHFRTHKGQTQ